MTSPKFRIVHQPIPEADAILLQRAANPDQATIYYHTELARLKRDCAYGELAVLRINGDVQTVVREPLRAGGTHHTPGDGSPAATTGARHAVVSRRGA